MNKYEIIANYGQEAYNIYKKAERDRQRARMERDPEYKKRRYMLNTKRKKARYHTDPEFHLKETLRKAKRYVKDGRLDLIENYELAKSDNFKDWLVHHKDGIRILPSGMIARRSKEYLIECNRYYNCPPNELIWLHKSKHKEIHKYGIIKEA